MKKDGWCLLKAITKEGGFVVAMVVSTVRSFLNILKTTKI
jgi:hypothetical protein